MRSPQARGDRIEVPPLHHDLALAAGSPGQAGVASRGNCFSGAAGRHSAQTQRRLEEEFERRRRTMLRACARQDVRATHPDIAWRQNYRHVVAGMVTFFKVPKAGRLFLVSMDSRNYISSLCEFYIHS